MNMQPTLIMLCSPPAGGKTTYCATLRAAKPEAAYICPDVIRASLGNVNDQSRNHHIFSVVVPSLIQSAASEGRDIVYDATSVTVKNRAGIIEQAKSLGYRIEVHVLRTTLEECVRRNATRTKTIPESVIHRMHAQFQTPTLAEGIDEIVEVAS